MISGPGTPDITQAIFSDCSEQRINVFNPTLTGLSRFEGTTVVVTVNGLVNGRYLVIGGTITLASLPTTGSTVTIGLDYTTTIEPNRIDSDSHLGVTQGLTKSVSRVNLRLNNSVGGYLAAGAAAQSIPLNYGLLPASGGVYTGEVESETLGDHGLDVPLVVTQPDPLPLTVLAIIPKFDVTGTV